MINRCPNSRSGAHAYPPLMVMAPPPGDVIQTTSCVHCGVAMPPPVHGELVVEHETFSWGTDERGAIDVEVFAETSRVGDLALEPGKIDRQPRVAEVFPEVEPDLPRGVARARLLSAGVLGPRTVLRFRLER